MFHPLQNVRCELSQSPVAMSALSVEKHGTPPPLYTGAGLGEVPADPVQAEGRLPWETLPAVTEASLLPLASAGPFVLLLANTGGADVLKERVQKGAVHSEVWDWGPREPNTTPMAELPTERASGLSLVPIHSSVVPALEHQKKILLPIL